MNYGQDFSPSWHQFGAEGEIPLEQEVWGLWDLAMQLSGGILLSLDIALLSCEGLCWAYPTLWLGGLTTLSVWGAVLASGSLCALSHSGSSSIPWVVLWELYNSSLYMTWLCSRSPGICFITSICRRVLSQNPYDVLPLSTHSDVLGVWVMWNKWCCFPHSHDLL